MRSSVSEQFDRFANIRYIRLNQDVSIFYLHMQEAELTQSFFRWFF